MKKTKSERGLLKRLRRVGNALCAGTLLAAALCMPVNAETIGTPFQTEQGYTLQITRLGWQKTGTDCTQETLYQMQIAFPGQSSFSQTVYFTRLGWYGTGGWEEDQDLNGMVVLKDLNFDGFPDLDILYNIGASNIVHTFFLWDNQQQRFTADNGIMHWLSIYELYPEKQIVYDYQHVSAAESVRRVYRWEQRGDGEKRLQLIREVELAEDRANLGTYYLIERVPMDGELTEIYRQPYSEKEIMESPEVDAEMNARLWKDL